MEFSTVFKVVTPFYFPTTIFIPSTFTNWFYIGNLYLDCSKVKLWNLSKISDEVLYELGIYKMVVLPVISGMKKYLKRHREIFNQ